MTWLNKILNVRPNEWARLLFLSLLLVITNVGFNWGTQITYAAFLKPAAGGNSGMQTLAWVLFWVSILSIFGLSIYTAFVDRINNNRLFAYIIALGAIVIVIGLTLWEMGYEDLAYPFLYVLSLVWLAVFNPHFFTYINDLFDIQSAKRALPIVLAAGRIGAAVAGFSLAPLMKIIDTQTIIWLWLASDILMVGMILAMPKLLKGHRLQTESSHFSRGAPQGESSSYLSSIREGVKFTVQSPFLRWMAAGTLILSALITLFEYYASQLLKDEFTSSTELAGYLGKLDGYSNLIALVVLLFALSRMTKLWGIGNASVLYPLLALFVGGGLASSPGLLTASLSYLARRGVRFSLQSPIEALLYNAIPVRIKGRARAFVGGLLSPFGAIVAVGILLVNLAYGEQLPGLVRGSIAFFSVAYLIVSFVIRYQYTQALVKMLEEEDFSFLLTDGASELIAADPATLNRLQKKLEESPSHEMRVFITQLIAQVGGEESLSILIPAIKDAKEARTRAAMLDVIAASGLRGEKVRELYADFIADPEPQVRQSAVSGLEQLLGAQDVWLRDIWLAMINDPDPQASFYALKSLAGTGEFFKFEPAVWKLDDLLKSESTEGKKKALELLGLIGEPKAIRQLLEFLADPNDQIRLEAILSLEKTQLPLNNDILDTHIYDFSELLLQDPVARIRQAALTVNAKFGKKESHALLISALADKSPQVRTTAVDLLAQIGKNVAPALQAALQDRSDPKIRKMATVVLSRVNPRQFSSQIEKIVSENLNDVYQSISLEDALMPHNTHRSVRALLSTLRERNNQLIDEILYLLSAVHDPQTLKVIGESLHSDSSSTRNLALEALESLTSPQTAALIASLFEPTYGPSQLLQLGEGSLSIERIDVMQALENLNKKRADRVPFLLSLHVMGDIGAQMIQSGEESRAARIRAMLEESSGAEDQLMRESVRDALEKILFAQQNQPRKSKPLSLVEKMVVLKEVPFFRNIPTDQLEAMSEACDEKIYAADERIFKTGDSGGSLYIIVNGQVKIEQEKRGGSTLLATLGDDAYFGEMSLFDNSPRSASAIAARESSIIELKRAPIIALTAQSPDMALELINMLSQRIRETGEKLAETVRSRPRELHKLFDQFN